jgi:ribose 5-phosphate isomerase B
VYGNRTESDSRVDAERRPSMRVAVAYDHRGLKSAAYVINAIEGQGHTCIDLGAKEEGVADCPDFAYIAAMRVVREEADTAVLLCNTGIGMSISANKVKGIRAARCSDAFEARIARSQFDANVLCLSGELLDPMTLTKIIENWLHSQFEERARSRRLICKIRAIEQGQDPLRVKMSDCSV